MSSIDNSGENEFAYEESNVVGKSEDNPEEEDKKILKAIKKEIEEKDKTNNNNNNNNNKQKFCKSELSCILLK